MNLTPLYPALLTFAAAIVAGGVARSNLIATKETKVSEFRQAWINSLREELSTLFSNTRTLARSVQEDRDSKPEIKSKFHFAQDKITDVRHGAAETYYRIKLRLNRDQDDHKELLKLLREMMEAQQRYMSDPAADVQLPLNQVEKASDQAEKVLKNEWRTVKGGEKAYRSAINITTWVLSVSVVIWIILVAFSVYMALTEPEQATNGLTSLSTSQAPSRSTGPATVSLPAAQGSSSAPKPPASK
ncbi:hypothetical protein [Janthinobacterium aquaticum]|uniref:hypothetical protein n=1 Tax=Janthinobacterium sp. FT58W TaxID=2654254 RepID=UPI0012647081|nr:hypothetical protein [Janthinobacterium sp. FT58W]KAB8041990.1 hypothetical protein GCM43_15190 [Janthinobacterium sp. FT58W]